MCYFTEAMGALWTLSFDKENQDVMLQDDAVMKNFINLRTSPIQRIKNACNGALWNMREKLSSEDKYKELGNGTHPLSRFRNYAVIHVYSATQTVTCKALFEGIKF